MTTFTESFTKADGVGLGPDLTWSAPDTQWQTSSNRAAIIGVTASEIRARAEHDTGTNDMYVQAVIPDFGNASYCDVGICARMSSDRQTYYVLKRGAASSSLSGFYELRKVIAGDPGPTESYLVPRVTHAFSFPETVRLEVQGTTLRVIINGVQVASVTDSGITGPGFAGLDGFRNSTSSNRRVLVDTFETGSLTASGTNYDRSVNDGAGLVDSIDMAGVWDIVLGEELGITDLSDLFALEQGLTLTDTAAGADSLLPVLAPDLEPTDLLVADDDTSTTVTAVRELVDVAGLTDSVSPVLVLPVNPTTDVSFVVAGGRLFRTRINPKSARIGRVRYIVKAARVPRIVGGSRTSRAAANSRTRRLT